MYLPSHEPSPVARTHASVMRAAQEAEASGVPVRGIKGISVLADSLDLVDGIPVDYMHSVLEGVTRWLLRAWFKTENHRELYFHHFALLVCSIHILLQDCLSTTQINATEEMWDFLTLLPELYGEKIGKQTLIC